MEALAIKALTGGGGGGSTDLTNVLNDFADAYSASSTYAVGDYCIHNQILYKCNTAISTAEAWTAGHWTAVNVGDEISSLNEDLVTKLPKPSSGLAVGKYFRIATYNSETGAITLEAVDDPATVKGVQAAGTDLVPDANGKVNIPYAESNTGGLIKTYLPYGFNISNGIPNASMYSYEQYKSRGGPTFISKRTLENVAEALGWTTIIKTTMDAVAVAGAQYYLGEQSTVNIDLPSTALAGQTIVVVFYSGSTATSLTVSGDTIGDVPTPSTNQRVELIFEWDTEYWSVLSLTQAVPVDSGDA